MPEENTKIEEKEPENTNNELEECKKKCDEYLNNWKRSAADFINYKKDEMERMAFLGQYAKENMILKILPILDSFYLAEKELPEKLKKEAREPQVNGSAGSPQVEWTKGFLQIHKQIEEFLKKEGIEEIETVRKKFNLETMEVVAASAEASASQGEEVVVEEIQKGYKIKDKVIRPSKVKISK